MKFSNPNRICTETLFFFKINVVSRPIKKKFKKFHLLLLTLPFLFSTDVYTSFFFFFFDKLLSKFLTSNTIDFDSTSKTKAASEKLIYYWLTNQENLKISLKFAASVVVELVETSFF